MQSLQDVKLVDSAPTPEPKLYLNLLDLPKFRRSGDKWLRKNHYETTKYMTYPWFADIRYCWRTPLEHSYPSVADRVIQSDRVIAKANEIAKQRQICVSAMLKQAEKFLWQMKASFSNIICRMAGYVLFKLFRKITRRILVSPEQMEQLKNDEKSGIPFVYVPLHKSHMDYLLITWSLYHWGIRLPHIASGDNLNLKGFGWLLRAFGAFFIRRSVDHEPNEVADENNTSHELYREVLNTYMTTILKYGMSIEFFLEGTRSRFGKILLPKNGSLKNRINVVAAVRNREVPDIYLVPVSISYDQVLEGNFYNELTGIRKKKETISSALRGFFRCFGGVGKCGTIVIDFGKPISLLEHLEALRQNIERHNGLINLKHETNPNSPRELMPWHHAIEEPEDRMLIRAVGYDAAYRAQRNKPITSAELIAMLILCIHREKPVLVSLFVCELRDLVAEVLSLGFQVVGWKSRTEDNGSGQTFLEEGLKYLGDSVIKTVNSDGQAELKMRSTSPKCYLDLAYRKNGAIAPYILVSMSALSILSLGGFTAHFEDCMDKTFQVCNLLQCEVIFCSPTEDLKAEIAKALNFFGISQPPSTPSLAAKFSLEFYANILRPFLETLLVTTQDLVFDPIIFEMTERQYVKKLLNKFLNRKFGGVNEFPMREAVNSDSVQNSIKLLRFKRIVAKHATMKLIDSVKAKECVRKIEGILGKEVTQEPKNSAHFDSPAVLEVHPMA
ncbi:acyltransferase domain-containing protein [Ditylenchus destructor]|uniref:Acyltransferase domain-containing protein n=1 Tax=Ditylenchus destructor TaxID=166010 RepID=A0AAD4MN75_9BILA|nr:acyltransferase domain-containing protein [Ditylenchus destructor]